MNFSAEIIKNTPTPFYYYDLNLLTRTLESCKKAADQFGYHVHYALKANVNEPILDAVRKVGFGADCVSGNEVQRAYDSGFPANQIVFAGVGKSDDEIIKALDLEIMCFNCESLPEIAVIDELAARTNKIARIALRINPNVNAKTHHYITTGLEENKFGINMWEMDDLLERLPNFKNIELIGLHFHIGSQIIDLSVFRGLCLRVNEIQDYFIRKHIDIKHLNLGGGLGIDYENPDDNPINDFAAFFQIFKDHLHVLPNQEIHFELGRCLVAQCGALIAKVLYVKEGVKTNFSILDAGMTELIRPALYQSFHLIQNLSSIYTETARYDVVGPICESSDCFGKAIRLPLTNRGDLIAIRSTGAYGEVMASRYNLRDEVRAVYVDTVTPSEIAF
jgi:diaminopimelate decarboxylase